MSRRLLGLLFLMTGALRAGPLKVASYPVRHPIKTEKAVAKAVMGAVKAVLW